MRKHDDSRPQRAHAEWTIGLCGKRTFSNATAAKQAHRRAHWRLRAYYCDRCAGYHVTNAEKSDE